MTAIRYIPSQLIHSVVLLLGPLYAEQKDGNLSICLFSASDIPDTNRYTHPHKKRKEKREGIKITAAEVSKHPSRQDYIGDRPALHSSPTPTSGPYDGPHGNPAPTSRRAAAGIPTAEKHGLAVWVACQAAVAAAAVVVMGAGDRVVLAAVDRR